MPDSKTTIPSLVVSAWRTAPSVLRRFAFWDWGIGVAAATVAIVGDARNWWDGTQFFPNFMAEVIFSVLALPFALLIIRGLTEFQVREHDRARLDARYATLLIQLAGAVRTTREHLQEIEQEADASTNAFVRAVRSPDGVVADPETANEKARIIHAQMDTQQWMLYGRIVAPLRIVGAHLQSLLIERDRDPDLADESTKFAQLWIELESALAQQKQTMANGHDLFGIRPAVTAPDVNGANRLRDMAIEHLNGIDRLLDLCDRLEAYAGSASLSPDVRR